ncbi:hypothetical protein, partial [Streptomyces clavuligerus]|uniref:hypothetical protein n=1 Tax=Streptomyces clavuligerus TaxID=1901 RepID=UPI001E4DA619
MVRDTPRRPVHPVAQRRGQVRDHRVAEVWARFQEAERTAHATIVALVGGKPLRLNDGSNAA